MPFFIVAYATGYEDVHAVNNNREMVFTIIYILGDMIFGTYLLCKMAALIDS